MIKRISIKYCLQCQDKYKIEKREVLGGSGIKTKCDVCGDTVEGICCIDIKELFKMIRDLRLDLT